MNARGPARCVVVGAGPGGVLLTYLLGRAGIEVTLLEARADFERDFRGDSLHPYTLELLATLGLAEDLLRLPHHRARHFRFHTRAGTVVTADYGRIASRYNYVALMPQSRFLEFMAGRIAELDHARVLTRSKATGLLTGPAERVSGVRCGESELPADLVVATDGRHSRMRRLAGLPTESLGATGDLLWFRLPRRPGDPPEADVDLYFGRDHYVALLGGVDDWQVGFTLPKGGYAAARDAGVTPIRNFVAEHVTWLADRVDLLTGFAQTTLLSVEISRVARWWRPGLLLLGDAAHVISPVGGNGILMAVQDAVAAANRLIPPLRAGAVGDEVLAAVQSDREPAIRRVQAQQVRTERRTARARDTGRPLLPPTPLLKALTALPGMRARAARRNAYGPHPPRLDLALLGT
ncbi:NAD(P)-binding protein [Nonomuraea phyllanthi]|uniref:NAD(P)-binding protein n=1 Tax=Nonomuraea phyllanthi TaxID=2219224 RepID=A0A5C4W1K6_9ACTN|nr:FAD-dependent oxidoreductase [Nonomuraea phyllanthi]KAB8190974.1 NAD(P)-binding protein [Nonomuraea phyllanthi]